MKVTRHLVLLPVISLCCAALILLLPAPASAGGDDKDSPSARPRPDRPKRVYTNDDLQMPGALPVAVSIAAPAEVEPAPTVSPVRPRAQVGPYVPEKDPVWYAEQVASLEAELARVDADQQHLRTFWNNGYAPTTGLILNAPCETISTNDRIAQLDDRHREIEIQLDALNDAAKRNGISRDISSQASEILEASRVQASVSSQGVRTNLRSQLTQAEEELAQTQGVVTAMEADTSSRNMTLLQPNGIAGSMTADLLQRLNARAAALQDQISTVEDDARRSGIEPGLLR